METLKEFQNILLRHEIEVFADHKNLTYETIQIVSQCVQRWKSLIQEFGVNLLYIKGEDNLVSDAFIRITMVRHSHKLADTIMEEDTCELLCLELLFISDNTYCLSLDIKKISFSLAPQIVEAEQNMELQYELITNIITNINKTNSDWKYKVVGGINFVHDPVMI